MAVKLDSDTVTRAAVTSYFAPLGFIDRKIDAVLMTGTGGLPLLDLYPL